MPRGSQRRSSDRDKEKDLPLWASMLLVDKVDEIDARQNEVMSRLASLELTNAATIDSKMLYSTIVKARADGEKIEGKLRRITWVGIGEQADEELRDRFVALRKEAGRRNANLGKLQYVVRNLRIHELNTPRELPRRFLSSSQGTRD
ncbi:hypothetical protein COOONC_26070 [Cooperia oncophora]